MNLTELEKYLTIGDRVVDAIVSVCDKNPGKKISFHMPSCGGPAGIAATMARIRPDLLEFLTIIIDFNPDAEIKIEVE